MKTVDQNLDQLYKIRHSLAHLMAKATIEIYPNAKPTIGPPTDNGFYYDFDFGEADISESDLKKIQSQMKKLLKNWQAFKSINLTTDEARELYRNNEYKLDLIEGIAANNEDITIYYSGPIDEIPSKDELLSGNWSSKAGFIDLCRGGHVDNPSDEIDINSFKLDSLAGAYWRGDENNKMLSRIYGLAFSTEEELNNYLLQREEAKKRDHRKLGAQLGLFAFSDLVGKGLPMMLPNGNLVYELLSNYIIQKKKLLGYKFVHIPHIAKKDLYITSGHMGKYDAMMPVMVDEDGDEYVMKAMNCPHHFELYNASHHSYRDLPLRYAENTTVYRNEKSGELHGLTRVKALTQDDTHHFIRHDQIQAEIEMVLGLVKEVYELFDFSDYKVEISVRDQDNKDKYFGDDDVWDITETILEEAVRDWGANYSIESGEAAFYGPKIDIKVNDSLGRSWQLATVQLDFIQPENFDLTYVDEGGTKQRPAVLHVAIFGSIERFMGILIEHYAGKFPFWLSPEQIHVLPIAESHHQYALEIYEKLQSNGIRSKLHTEDSLGKRIRNAKTNLVPYFIVIGDDELNNQTATLEGREESETLSVEELIEKLSLKNKV